MNQLSLFDTFRAPPILRSVDPDGQVVKGEVRESFVLPHPRYAFPRCRIELHPSGDGLWMWSVSFHTDDGCGNSYRVGEKWGKFALTRDDALHYARGELEAKLAERLLRSPCKSIAKIRAWANSLTLEAVA
jgi:hypothetical protein